MRYCHVIVSLPKLYSCRKNLAFAPSLMPLDRSACFLFWLSPSPRSFIFRPVPRGFFCWAVLSLSVLTMAFFPIFRFGFLPSISVRILCLLSCLGLHFCALFCFLVPSGQLLFLVALSVFLFSFLPCFRSRSGSRG